MTAVTQPNSLNVASVFSGYVPFDSRNACEYYLSLFNIYITIINKDK